MLNLVVHPGPQQLQELKLVDDGENGQGHLDRCGQGGVEKALVLAVPGEALEGWGTLKVLPARMEFELFWWDLRGET